MSRITNLIAILIMLVGIASVYSFKEETRALNDKTQQLRSDIEAENKEISRLKAAWAILNDTQRVASLSKNHLELKSPEASDYITFNDIPRRPQPLNTQPDGGDMIEDLIARLGQDNQQDIRDDTTVGAMSVDMIDQLINQTFEGER